ncbi:sigma-70 family RNA polymerase sigma factor [Paenibacillus sp. GCM10023252]|uniref:sigma-70 family RNA polymerase sigma factor n=1 Tax=Paenibacillus sp. GCM10023252 TaxID=3252649 RepID=UPI003613EDD7
METSAPNLFRECYETHYPSVRRKLIAIVKDEAAAEDLAQEVFLKLYRNPPDEFGAVGAWLHRVLTRMAYDHIDKKTRERALAERQGLQIQTEQGSSASNEELLIQQEDRQQVQGWLDALPERDRKLLMLRYEGCSYAEIAEKMQVRLPQVGTMLRRAGERFKRQAVSGKHGITTNE